MYVTGFDLVGLYAIYVSLGLGFLFVFALFESSY